MAGVKPIGSPFEFGDRAMPHRDPPPSSRVLIVEDDTETRVLLTRLLRENGLHAAGVRDGREMWEAVDQVPMDLVILDVMLPGIPSEAA